MPSPILEAFWLPVWLSRYREQSRFLEAFPARHHGPGHPRDLVGERHGRDLNRPPLHDTREPDALRAMLPRIPDDGHGAVSSAIAPVHIRLVVRADRIVRADGRALESAAQDAGEARRRPDQSAEGALSACRRRVDQVPQRLGAAPAAPDNARRVLSMSSPDR